MLWKMVLMEDTKKDAKIVEKTESVAGAEQITIPRETSEYFKGDEIRARVFFEKYALKDDMGKTVETMPAQMWTRVAKAIAEAEVTEQKKVEWDQNFRWLLSDFRFLPGGRI